jgi:hypothetical protein
MAHLLDYVLLATSPRRSRVTGRRMQNGDPKSHSEGRIIKNRHTLNTHTELLSSFPLCYSYIYPSVHIISTMSQPQLFQYQSFRTYGFGNTSVSNLNLAGLTLHEECDSRMTCSLSSSSSQSPCSTPPPPTTTCSSSLSSRGKGWGSTETRKAYTSLHSLSHHTSSPSKSLPPLQQQQQDDEEEEEEDDSVGFDMDMEMEMDNDNFW